MGKSSGLTIVLAGARLICLGVLALLLTSPCDSGVGAVTFAFKGFQEDSLYSVPDSSWIFNPATGCFQIDPAASMSFSGSSGRLLYPSAVQMIDPGKTTVKSFSTSFIYRFQRMIGTGPGLAFIIVPDNFTLGAPGDFMGLITSENSVTGKNYESDDHTLGVELDTYKNPQFNDPSSNHIGINLASMNSTSSFTPAFNLASRSKYQQIWIDYDESDSRMDIYFANYKERKPEKPQLSKSGLDLSLLKEKMFTGFSSASYPLTASDMPYVCAWSFSNDGSPAPSIVLAQDKIRVGVPVLLTVFVGMIICIIVSLCWFRFVSRPLRIFISHAGGPDGSQKNFPTWLDERMKTYRWSVGKSRVRIFFDTEDVEMGKSIAKKILRELARFDVGVVVVTNAFFVAKWPMTELIAFVEAQMNDPTERIRVLPLFYELSPEQVRTHLVEKTWEGNWEGMSKGNHPLQVEKCRQAVNWLCQQRGIPYGYNKRHQDKVYIETICKVVDEILCKERSFTSYLIGTVKTYCIPSRSKPGMTIHETEMTLL